MRGLLTLFSLFALASTSVFASPIDQCLDEYCGGKGFSNSSPGLTDPAASIAKIETPTRSIPERSLEEMTNAERFSRGLPPKKPKQFRGSRVRRTEASAVPRTSYRGIIRVDKADGTGNLGYVSAHPFSGAQYRYESIDKALIVSFTAEASQSSGLVLDLSTENSDIQGSFTLLGLVQGRDNINSDLASGSYQYVYLGGTNQTPPGSPPANVGNSYNAATGTSRTSESAVWQFDSVTKAFTLQWVNSSGPNPQTVLFTQSTALYAGGDKGAFASRYPSPVVEVTYTFVPL